MPLQIEPLLSLSAALTVCLQVLLLVSDNLRDGTYSFLGTNKSCFTHCSATVNIV